MRLAIIGLGIAGVLLSWAGGAWDVSWHRTIGRDTFWSPPHLLLYGGVAAAGLAAIGATIAALRAPQPVGPQLGIGPLRADRALAIIGLGALGMVAMGPFDEVWHATFGRDVDIWSPPHLLAIGFASWVYIGCALALERDMFPLPEPVRVLFRAVALAALCGLVVFGMNFYYFSEPTREAFFYPLAIAATIPFVLGLGAVLVPGRWSASAIAALYTIGALETHLVLQVAGWLPPALPPLVLAGAVALDVVRARSRSALAAGSAFAVAFVAAEALRRLPLVVALVPMTARDSGALFRQYLAQAQARPWDSLWPVLALPLAAAIAAVAWAAGHRLATALTSAAGGGQRRRSTESPSPLATSS